MRINEIILLGTLNYNIFYFFNLVRQKSYMGITCSPLPQNNGNLPLPFFGGNHSEDILEGVLEAILLGGWGVSPPWGVYGILILDRLHWHRIVFFSCLSILFSFI